MSEPESIAVTVDGEPITIYEGTYGSASDQYDMCDVCKQDKRTLEVGEVHTYNRIHVCLACLRQAIGCSSHDDLLAALEPAFERCKTSGNFHPTMDWMKIADAAIAKAKEDSHD